LGLKLSSHYIISLLKR